MQERNKPWLPGVLEAMRNAALEKSSLDPADGGLLSARAPAGHTNGAGILQSLQSDAGSWAMGQGLEGVWRGTLP